MTTWLVLLVVVFNVVSAVGSLITARRYGSAALALTRTDEARERATSARDDLVRTVSERLDLVVQRVTAIEGVMSMPHKLEPPNDTLLQ